MFDSTSRYARLNTGTVTTSDGRTVTYVRRRFLPRGDELELLAEVKTEGGDRLDLISHRALGNSLLYWRICDATNAMNPFDLTEEVGTTLRVPMPTSGIWR